MGREPELARVLSACQAAGVTNVVLITADVHYTAAHHYSPERAAYTDFDPFWEFVSGPLAAETFPRKDGLLDRTFGPRGGLLEGQRLAAATVAAGRQPVLRPRRDRRGRCADRDPARASGVALWTKTLEPAGH